MLPAPAAAPTMLAPHSTLCLCSLRTSVGQAGRLLMSQCSQCAGQASSAQQLLQQRRPLATKERELGETGMVKISMRTFTSNYYIACSDLLHPAWRSCRCIPEITAVLKL